MQKLMLFAVLAACGQHKEEAESRQSVSSPVAPPADAASLDAAFDASPWLAGEKPVPRTAANDSPKMCSEPDACSSACDQGDGAGCYWLGVMHATKSDVDLGVPYDPAKALAKFLVACDLGVTLGCNGAAQIFRLGSMGLPSDPPRAQRLFDKACGLGMDAACANAKSIRTK